MKEVIKTTKYNTRKFYPKSLTVPSHIIRHIQFPLMIIILYQQIANRFFFLINIIILTFWMPFYLLLIDFKRYISQKTWTPKNVNEIIYWHYTIQCMKPRTMPSQIIKHGYAFLFPDVSWGDTGYAHLGWKKDPQLSSICSSVGGSRVCPWVWWRRGRLRSPPTLPAASGRRWSRRWGRPPTPGPPLQTGSHLGNNMHTMKIMWVAHKRLQKVIFGAKYFNRKIVWFTRHIVDLGWGVLVNHTPRPEVHCTSLRLVF